MQASTPADERVAVLPHTRSERLEGLDEAAILFSAGHGAAARAVLETLCDQGMTVLSPWTMLFDVLRAHGERDDFEALLPRFGKLFPQSSVPTWSTPPLAAAASTLRLGSVLEGASDLEPLVARARTHRVLAVDLGDVLRIDFAFAPVLCATLRQMVIYQSRKVILANVAELHGRVLAIAGLPPEVVVLPRRAALATPATPVEARILEAA